MRSMRRAAVRAVGALFLVALLVVSVAASGHTHRDLQTARSCATCVAAHHSPAVLGVTTATGAPATPALAVPSPAPVVVAQLHRSPRAGRAPPAPAPVPVA